MTAHQPAREGDGGSANIDKGVSCLYHTTDSFSGVCFFLLKTIKNIEIEVNNYG